MAFKEAEHLEPRTGWRDFLADGRSARFALICLGVWLNAADSLVTATIMPSVGVDIGGYAYFGWATAGFLMGAILASAAAGRVSEIVGLRLATASAGLLLAGGCVLSAIAPDIGVFLIGRLLQGVGGGGISGFAMVAIALLFPERHLARVFASISAVWGIATVLAPLVGGLFAQSGDWRAVFWVFALQALLFATATPWLLSKAPPSRTGAGIPWRQLATLAVGVGAISVADVSPSPATAIALIMAGLGLVGLVLRIDGREEVRLLPNLASDLRTVPGSGYLALFAFVASSMGLLVYGPAVLQELHGLSPLWAGYVVAAQALSWTLASFVVAGASDAGQRRWIRTGAGCILASLFLMMLAMPGAGLGHVVAAAAVMGAGFGVSVSLINRRIIGALADEDRAIGGSALMAARQTGGAVGAAIAGATANLVGFSAGLTPASAQATALWVFATALPLALVGAWAAWQLTRGSAEESVRPLSKKRLPARQRHPLLQALELLDLQHRRELACAVSILWDELTGELGDPDGNLTSTSVERRAYVASMRAAADLVRSKVHPDQRYYALAPELMALHIEVVDQVNASAEDLKIAAHVPEVAARGRVIREEKKQRASA